MSPTEEHRIYHRLCIGERFEEMKELYWEHFTDKRNGLMASFMTNMRLHAVRDYVWSEEALWIDVFVRHGYHPTDPEKVFIFTPDQMKSMMPEEYKHCFENMMMAVSTMMLDRDIYIHPAVKSAEEEYGEIISD